MVTRLGAHCKHCTVVTVHLEAFIDSLMQQWSSKTKYAAWVNSEAKYLPNQQHMG